MGCAATYTRRRRRHCTGVEGSDRGRSRYALPRQPMIKLSTRRPPSGHGGGSTTVALELFFHASGNGDHEWRRLDLARLAGGVLRQIHVRGEGAPTCELWRRDQIKRRRRLVENRFAPGHLRSSPAPKLRAAALRRCSLKLVSIAVVRRVVRAPACGAARVRHASRSSDRRWRAQETTSVDRAPAPHQLQPNRRAGSPAGPGTTRPRASQLQTTAVAPLETSALHLPSAARAPGTRPIRGDWKALPHGSRFGAFTTKATGATSFVDATAATVETGYSNTTGTCRGWLKGMRCKRESNTPPRYHIPRFHC